MVVATIVVDPSSLLDPSVPVPPTPSSTVQPTIDKPMQQTRARPNMEPRYANASVAEREKGTLTEAKTPFRRDRRYAARSETLEGLGHLVVLVLHDGHHVGARALDEIDDLDRIAVLGLLVEVDEHDPLVPALEEPRDLGAELLFLEWVAVEHEPAVLRHPHHERLVRLR